MIIRSQNGKALTLFESGVVHLKTTDSKVVLYDSMQCENGIIEIARYSTEEKAIKVLDMISNTYAGTCYTDKEFNGLYQCSVVIKNNVVFEMPQDNQV